MTTKLQLFRGLAVAIATFAVTAQGAGPEIVYQNAEDPILGTIRMPNGITYGNEVNLGVGGDHRIITEISIEYNNNVAIPTGSGVIQLWNLDGPATPDSAASPGTMIFESTSFGLLPGFNTVTISDIAVGEVPDNIVWTATWSGQTDGGIFEERTGLILRDPPAIGSGPNDFWANDGVSGWALLQGATGDSRFAAEITAIPEPGVISLLVLGAGFIFGSRYLRRRSA